MLVYRSVSNHDWLDPASCTLLQGKSKACMIKYDKDGKCLLFSAVVATYFDTVKDGKLIRYATFYDVYDVLCCFKR